MKATLLLLATTFLIAHTSSANTLMVSAQGTTFAPNTGTIHLGDTVMFMWVDGTHTTTSTSVPGAAANWNNPLDATHTSFIYVPTVLGIYNYQCTFHASMGMTGTFTVVSPISVATVNSTTFKLFPNPASNTLHLQFDQSIHPATVTITDANGKPVLTTTTSSQSNDISVAELPIGLYFVKAEQGGVTYIERVVITH